MAGEGEVTLPQDLPGRGNIKSEQSAIRLSEVGNSLFPQVFTQICFAAADMAAKIISGWSPGKDTR